MNSFSIVILSKSLSNFTACAQRIRDMGERAPIILVDDGIEGPVGWWKTLGPLVIVPGKKPFVFARNANIGILAANASDVVLMNDDALLETPAGLSALQTQWYAHPEHAVISACADLVGTQEQLRRSGPRSGLRVSPIMVAFMCVFIPREMLRRVGLLDEQFCLGADGDGPRGYGCEDDDWCWRARRMGYKLGVYDGCYINHTTLPSTFRGGAGQEAERPWDVTLHEQLFAQKWGKSPRRP